MRGRKFLTRGLTFLLSLVFIVFGTVTWVHSSEIPQQATASPPSLFTPIASSKVRGLDSQTLDTAVVRQRFVKANLGILSQSRGQAVRLNLFDDATYNVLIERVESHGGKQTRGLSTPRFGKIEGFGTDKNLSVTPTPNPAVSVKFGRIQGMPKSEVYLASQENTLFGSVSLPDGKSYKIAPVPVNPNVYAIQEINRAAFPPDESPDALESIQKPPLTRDRDASDRGIQESFNRQSSSVLKVLVLYTPTASRLLGGNSQIPNFVAALESQTNQGNQQSGVNLQVEIAGAYQVGFTEYGNSGEDLTALAKFANRQNLLQRFQVQAVSLWVGEMRDACGIGYLNTTAESFPQLPYNVVQVNCALNNYAFAHELGHNLGSAHDFAHAGNSPSIFPFSYGYQDPYGDFGTIMAYRCRGNGNGCPRINYWSSPNLFSYENKPLGIDEQADNVRSLNTVY
jgi:Metallo-peptidase family M12